MKPLFVSIMAFAAAWGAPAYAATYSAKVEGENVIVLSAKGGKKDEVCNARVDFQYRDAKSAADSQKEPGFQACGMRRIPARKTIELCRMSYDTAKNITIADQVTATCDADAGKSKKPGG